MLRTSRQLRSNHFWKSFTRMSSNITLWTFGTPNGYKASVTLEELGLEYKTEVINISTNKQKEPWFLEINPNGRIPAIKDGDLRVFESAAIMQYLTDKYDKDHKISFPQGSNDYYEALSWIAWAVGGLGPMQGQANHFRLMAGARSDYGIKRYIDETKRLLSVLESQLSKTEYLVANKYSTADIASYCWVVGAPILDIDLSEFPGVTAWIKRIDTRDAVVKGKKVGAMKSPEEMKEIFANMKKKMDEKTVRKKLHITSTIRLIF